MRTQTNLLCTLLAGALLTAAVQSGNAQTQNEENDMSKKTVHDFSVKDIDGKEVALSSYEGDVLLIVNVASQ